MAPPKDNNDEINKMLALGMKLLKLVSSLNASCKDCEKCKEYKTISEKTVILFTKIIALQAEDIKELEGMLNEALEAIEKFQIVETEPKTLH